MNFNIGEVLSRAGQITWKYKVLWVPGIVIALISLISIPISLTFYQPSAFMSGDPAEINARMGSMFLVNGLILLVTIVSVPLYVVGLSIPSLATRRLEMGEDNLNFIELARDSLRYFWRVLGIFALIWLGMVGFMMVFMSCIAGLSVITLGFGALCAVPLFLLFIPLAIVTYSLMELGMSAVVVDDLGMGNALRRAWDLLKRNLGSMAILSIIIYFGSMVVSLILSTPMMIPMFGALTNMSAAPDIDALDSMFRNMILWMLAFSPIYAVLQGVLLAYMQSVWTLAYMRIVKPQGNAPVVMVTNP